MIRPKWSQCYLIASILIASLGASLAISTVSAFQVESRLVVDKSEISIEKNTGERVYKGIPFTGDAVTFYPSGQMAILEQYQDGRWQGYKKRWFANGSLSSEAYYQNGYSDGLHTSWWGSGNLRSQTHYQAGQLHGSALKWYPSGVQFKKLNYLNGQPTGLQQAWRENGKLFSNFEYKNGRIYGLNKANLCVVLEDEEISLGL